MKTLTQLSATPGEGEFNARGSLTSLFYEQPDCKGWFIEIALSHVGLKFRAKRPGGESAAIPLDELIALARVHAPEIFATPEAFAEAQAAANKRAAETIP
ncbi:MAG TPA: hypothetical protein VGF13_09830 [Verrucomicrobiae bacterium]|jgi:hypothetical protein